jgi:hypothetical protein
VGVYDGTHLILYVDGEPDATAIATGRIRRNDWRVFIGENSEQTNREWDGLIDDVRIYSYALSPEEVKMLYEGKEPPGIKDQTETGDLSTEDTTAIQDGFIIES